MSRTTPSHPVVSAYKQYGDTCPPKLELYRVLDSLDENMPIHRPRVSPEHWLVAAHACGDLIMRHAKTPDHIALLGPRASGALKTIVTSGNRLKQELERREDLRPTLSQVSPYTIQAMLQKPDIRLWQEHALGADPHDRYMARLQAAQEAIDFPVLNKPARSILTDFMPVLLGARGQYQGTGGWVGRLALYREGQRPNDDGKTRQNWGAGLCFPDLTSGHNLLNPMRVKVMSSIIKKTSAGDRFYKAGVACITAEECGFYNPAQVVLSCVNEFEPVSPPQGMELLHSEQLDAVTQKVETNVRASYERATIAEQAYRQTSR